MHFEQNRKEIKMAFRGKVAIVTGGGSGMGQLEAWKLADTGAQIAIIDLNEDGMKKTAEGRKNIHPYRLDVTDNNAVVKAVADIKEKFGEIDRVTHAAGIMPAALVVNEDPVKMNRLMEINYGGTVNIMMATLPAMITRDSGDFIAFGSTAGYCPSAPFAAYSATKAAVNYLMEVAYYENLKSKVRIMIVAPPITNTPLLQQAPEAKGVHSRATDPHVIVDAIERDIEKGCMVCFGNFEGKAYMLLHKWLPRLTWNMVLKQEGLK